MKPDTTYVEFCYPGFEWTPILSLPTKATKKNLMEKPEDLINECFEVVSILSLFGTKESQGKLRLHTNNVITPINKQQAMDGEVIAEYCGYPICVYPSDDKLCRPLMAAILDFAPDCWNLVIKGQDVINLGDAWREYKYGRL